MLKATIYKIVRFGVIVSFLYLFFFENSWNIDGFIIKITNCTQEEVIGFKIVFVIIIVIFIGITVKYLEHNKSYFLDNSMKEYTRKYPIRVLFMILFLLWFIVFIITVISGYKKYLILLLVVLLIALVGTLGFFIGKSYNEPEKKNNIGLKEQKK